MREYAICIPTHNRRELLSLALLEDSDVVLNYFVREELYETGFYDFLKPLPRVNVISIGRGFHELGETREFIMQWCRDNDVRYCVMLDDGVDDISYEQFDQTFPNRVTSVIKDMIDDVDNSLMKDLCIGATFQKYRVVYPNGTKSLLNYVRPNRKYFGHTPTQAVLLNVERCKKFGLHYKSLDEVGFEDCAFFIDAVKKGCVYYSDPQYRFSAIAPNAKKPGGSHDESESTEHKYDVQMQRCMNYIGPMYGVHMQKRYRNYAGTFLTMIEIAHDYFYEVLVCNRHANKKIIDSQFKIFPVN